METNQRILNITSMDRKGWPKFSEDIWIRPEALQVALGEDFQPAVVYVYDENQRDPTVIILIPCALANGLVRSLCCRNSCGIWKKSSPTLICEGKWHAFDSWLYHALG